ncbi:MAG TPA: hypothetical protein VF266_26090 [Thermoanaerobaculia bacterium]
MIRTLILLLLAAVPLSAQDAQFFIERIEVRNHKRVSKDVIVAESRLREGRAYSEEELRDASTRLGRLPFLLSTEFALEKGSERGRHVLVLTVHETRPFFYLIDAVAYFDPQQGPLTADEDSRGATSENLALGFRWFVGRRGALHVGLSGIDRNREFAREYGAFSVGYTQYDLFGTRAFATLNVRQPIEPSGGRLSPQLVVGVPLSANQTVTVLYDELHTRGLDQRLVTARWSYNTTNEPFFPTRGSLVYAGPVAGWLDGTGRGNSRGLVTHSNFIGVEGGAARYFELAERDTVWSDLRAEWARNDYRASDVPGGRDESTRYGSIGLGYSRSLWSREQRANGDSRFELTGRYSRRSRSLEEQSVVFTGRDREVAQVAGAWVRRSSWGTLRLGVGYAW